MKRIVPIESKTYERQMYQLEEMRKEFPDFNYDTDIPIEYMLAIVKNLEAHGITEAPIFVWAYDKDSLCGYPIALNVPAVIGQAIDYFTCWSEDIVHTLGSVRNRLYARERYTRERK